VATLPAVVGFTPTAWQSGFRVDRPTFVYVMTVACLSVHHRIRRAEQGRNETGYFSMDKVREEKCVSQRLCRRTSVASLTTRYSSHLPPLLHHFILVVFVVIVS
jgi:hypothetical protein